MTLPQLEKAISGQFMWIRRHKKATETQYEYEIRLKRLHRLYVDEQRECIMSMALIVFCALARRYYFRDDEVAAYLEIKEERHSWCLTIYDRYMQQAALVKDSGRRIDPCKPYGKLYNKMGLCTNYLNYHVR